MAALTPIAQQIWDMKYRLKAGDGTPVDKTINDTWRRVANALAAPEKDPTAWSDKFYDALSDFKVLPAGRIIAGAGTGRRVTLFNCFVMNTIEDDMGTIFDNLREAALPCSRAAASVMTFRPCGPKGRWSKASVQTHLAPCRLWMYGTRCAEPSCRPGTDAAR